MNHYGKHQYYDVSDLNAPYDQAWMPPGWPNPPLTGLAGGSLSGNALGIRGIGAIESLPWKEYSDETIGFQKDLNAELPKRGYLQIAADGKLGPATCGAAQAMPPFTIPTTCQEFAPPIKAGSQPVVVGPKPSGQPSDVPPVQKAGMFGGGSSTWLIIGGGVAVAAIGAAVMFRKKRPAATPNRRRRRKAA